MIINLLSILGLQSDLNLQQYLINKQMLLSLTEALAQDIRYQQSGVQILALMPNINQRNLLRNKDWISAIGLQNLLLDQGRSDLLLDDTDRDLLLGQQDVLKRVSLRRDVLMDNNLRRDLMRDDLLLGDDLRGDLNRGQGRRLLDDDLRRQRLQRMERNEGRLLTDDNRRDQILGMDDLLLRDDLRQEQGQLLGGLSLDGRRIIDLLARNMIRGIELGQNGMLLLIGLQGSKNLQKGMQLSRL